MAARTAIVQAEGDSGLRFLLAAFEFETQFDKEKLLEDQADVRGGARGVQILQAFAGIRPVNLPQRLARRSEAEMAADGSGKGIRKIRGEVLERAADDAAEPARGQAPLAGGFVDGNNSSHLERRDDLVFRPSGEPCAVVEKFELGLDQLQASLVKVLLHLSVESNPLPGLEAVAQVRGVKPDAFEPGSSLTGRHLENRHATGAEETGVADFGDDRRHFPAAQFRDAPRVEAIFIAKRQIMEKVVDGVNAFGTQHLGQARPDAFDVLHGSGQLEHRKDVSRWRMAGISCRLAYDDPPG